MKNSNAKSVSHSENEGMSGFIGTVLSLVISVLVWIQKMGCNKCGDKENCPETCEFANALEQLKQITDQAEAMSNTLEKGPDCACEMRDPDYVAYDTDYAKRCSACCAHISNGDKVAYAEVIPYPEKEGVNEEIQTSVIKLQDTATETNEEQYTQDNKSENSSKIECLCKGTQVSVLNIRDAQNQDYTTQAEDMQYLKKAKRDTRFDSEEPRNVCPKFKQNEENDQIAAVYRSLIGVEAYDTDFDEEEINYYDSDITCSEQYRPCPQTVSPYSQQTPPQMRTPSPYARREMGPVRQDRPSRYSSYEPSLYKREYICSPRDAGNPIYGHRGQVQPRLQQPYPPRQIYYPPYSPEQRIPRATPPNQRAYPQQYPTSNASSRSASPAKNTGPVRECEVDCLGSKQSVRVRSPAHSPARYVPANREIVQDNRDYDETECIPQCAEYVIRRPNDDCIQQCPGYEDNQKHQNVTPKEESIIQCPRYGRTEQCPKEDCIPQTGYEDGKNSSSSQPTMLPSQDGNKTEQEKQKSQSSYKGARKVGPNQKECVPRCSGNQKTKKNLKPTAARPAVRKPDCDPNCSYHHMVNIMPNGARPIDPSALDTDKQNPRT